MVGYIVTILHMWFETLQKLDFKKIAPSLNKTTANKVDQVVERSMQQVITQGG